MQAIFNKSIKIFYYHFCFYFPAFRYFSPTERRSLHSIDFYYLHFDPKTCWSLPPFAVSNASFWTTSIKLSKVQTHKYISPSTDFSLSSAILYCCFCLMFTFWSVEYVRKITLAIMVHFVANIYNDFDFASNV